MPDPIPYTLYLDSCGDPGWVRPNGESTVKYYVVAGLALTSVADMKADQEVNRLLTEYIPNAEAQGFKREICYHHLIRGKDQYEELEPARRFAMSNEIFDLLPQLNPVLFATVVNKVRMKERYGIRAYDPKVYAIQATIHRFAMFLKRQTNGIGNVVMDAEEYKKDRLLQEMVRTFKRTGIVMRGYDYQPRFEEKLDRILNTIAFCDSDLSPGIQLADVCSRTTWQYFEHKLGNRYGQLKSLWNRSDTGTIYEPSVVPR
jgi:hypothetical protein